MTARRRAAAGSAELVGGASGPTMGVGDVRSSAAVAGWTLVSRVTGLLRVAAIAATLGPTYFGNLFQATNLLPNITYEFLTGSLFASLLVPAIVRHADSRDRRSVERVAGGFLGVALAGFLVATVVAVAFGPLIIRVLTLGVADPDVVADQLRVGWPLLALLMPQVFCYATIGTAVAVQQAHGRFAFPAAAPALENLGIIAILIGYGVAFGDMTDLSAAGSEHVLWLGIGTTAAVVLHATAQWFGARSVGVLLRPRLGWTDPEVRKIIRLAIPSLGYAGLNSARLVGILVVASSIPGGVVAFQLAFAFYNLPDALIGRPIAQATLPGLSRAHLDADRADFGRRLAGGVSLALFLAVPAAVGYFVLAGPIARAVSTGNMAGDSGVSLVTAAMLGLAGGTVGAVALVIGTHASYARRDARMPLTVMVVRSLLALAAMVAVLVVSDTPSLLALGLIVSGTDLVAAGLIFWLIGRVVPLREDGRLAGAFWRAVVAVGVIAGVTALVAMAGDSALSGPGSAALVVLMSGFAGLVAYIGTQALLRSSDLAALTGGLRARREGGPG